MSGIGPIDGYTSNYSFQLISYDFPRWQSYEHDNWTLLDTTLAVLFGGAGISGIWKNGVTYNINERLIDESNNTLYLCLVDHTTPDTGLFSDERAANPSYWRSLSFVPSNRGLWAAGVQYATGDFVQFGNQFAVCAISHLSINFTNDATLGYWQILIDLSGYNPVLALQKSFNLSDLANVTTARTNLGLGTASTHADTEYFRVANSLSEGNAVTVRANLGILSSALHPSTDFVLAANNLSDLANEATARTNLGLGTLATQTTIAINQINGSGVNGQALIATTTPAQAAAYIGAATNLNGGIVPQLPTVAPTSQYLRGDNSWNSPFDIGEIRQFGGLYIPNNWLECDGSSYAAATYPSLYAALVASSSVTISNATAAVITWTNHRFRSNYPVSFAATLGVLPAPITAGTVYYVVAGSASSNTFQISAAPGGAAINTAANTNTGTYTGACAPYGISGVNFSVPDFRGVVLRSLDEGRGFDTNRVIGTYQADGNKSHNHTLHDPGHLHGIPVGNATNNSSGTGSSVANNSSSNTNTSTTGITIDASGNAEATMKNYSVLTCIRAQ